jgi:hypothetical protein
MVETVVARARRFASLFFKARVLTAATSKIRRDIATSF